MKKISSFILLTIIVIALSSGLVLSVFAHSIEAALTVPARLSVPPQHTPPGTETTPRVAMTPPTVATATATSVSMNAILAQDTFQRADQLFWGMAVDGQTWSADAATQHVFSIVGQTGHIANGTGAFNATLGPLVSDAEVAFSGSMNQFHQSNLGAVLRWLDINNWYKAYIDGTNLVILKKSAGTGASLGAVPFNAIANVSYTLRFQVIGTRLSAKAWQTSQTEPPGWQISVADTALHNGYGGIRVVLNNDSVANFTIFKETTVMAIA